MSAAVDSLVAALGAALHPRTLLLGAVAFLFFVDFLRGRRRKNYPPGPWRLPFLGNFFHVDFKQLHLTVQPLVKKYGNLVRLELGNMSLVVITGLPLIKEVYTHMNQNFMDRPTSPGRKEIYNNNGQPFDPHFTINNAASNIICSITFGERFEYQDENVQAEIDGVIGQWKQPSLADRESMPYTNAVIHEVQRMGNILPLNVVREVTVDTTLAGCHLPKGTFIMTDLTALHRDPKEWATPDTFNPEHFLENGLFKKRDSFLPLSMGKRACLGEQLAMAELFIFFTSLMQKCTSKPPVDEKLSEKFTVWVILSPVSHHLCAIPRA